METLHSAGAGHTIAVPEHTPVVHTSPAVHAELSSQGSLSGLAVWSQAPVVVLHAAVWQVSDGVQTVGVSSHAPVVVLHVEVMQVPDGVQTFAVSSHAPVVVLHAEVWQLSDGVQTLAVSSQAPVVVLHVEVWQPSEGVQTNAVCSGVPLLQVSVVQGLLSFCVSVSSFRVTTNPFPSHTSCLQSPAVCVETATPSATFSVPHWCVVLSHVLRMHSDPVSPQSAGTRHPTQFP